MTVAAWPETLPQRFLVQGYNEQIAGSSNLLRSQNEVGPAKVRRRSTAAARNINGSMFLTIPQLVAFRTFYNDSIQGGSMPFTFPDPHGGDDLLVRFGDSVPTIDPAGPLDWTVKMQIEVLP